MFNPGYFPDGVWNTLIIFISFIVCENHLQINFKRTANKY